MGATPVEEVDARMIGADVWLAETETETDDEVETGDVEEDDETGLLTEVETVAAVRVV